MSRMRVGQKAHRALDFLVGVSHRRARAALETQGFTAEDLAEGWARLMALSSPGRTVLEPVAPAPDVLGELQAFEGRWVPVCEVVLRLNFPAVHAVVLHKLGRTEGPDVVASITVLLDRLEAIARPEEEGGLGDEGRRARALLAQRKLTDEVIAEGRALLARIGRAPDAPTEEELDELDREARALAEQRLWSWYLEWSTLARLAIRDRSLLRSLGFRRPGRVAAGSEEDV